MQLTHIWIIEGYSSVQQLMSRHLCNPSPYDNSKTCNERAAYIMQRYHLSEQKARESIMDRCGVDYSTEPYVMLHVGPHKTGTTAIQSFIYHALFKNRTFLRDDNWSIPTSDDMPGEFGKEGAGLNFAHCQIRNYVKDGGQMNTHRCNMIRLHHLPKFVGQSYNESRNVLIIAEDLDRKTIDYQRMQYYLRPYKRFRVVVAYRRLHEWLPSWYNQIVDLYKSVYIRGEATYPSFVDWIDSEYHNFMQVHAMNVAKRYRESGKFESVRVFSMHDQTPLLENVFCNQIKSPATCKAIRDGAKPPKPNTGKMHEYERLAIIAYRRKKLKHVHAAIASKVANGLRQVVVELGIFSDADAYPKTCLNETFMEHLLALEMEQEREWFPDSYEAQGGDEGLKSAFHANKDKLCAMNVHKILDSGILDDAFEKLNCLGTWDVQRRRCLSEMPPSSLHD